MTSFTATNTLYDTASLGIAYSAVSLTREFIVVFGRFRQVHGNIVSAGVLKIVLPDHMMIVLALMSVNQATQTKRSD